MSENKFISFLKKKPVIAGIVAVLAIIIIAAVIIFNNNGNEKNNSPNSTKIDAPKETATPKETQSTQEVTNTPADTTPSSVTAEPANDSPEETQDTKQEETATPDTSSEIDIDDYVDESNTEAGINALKKKEEAEKNQTTFDSYLENNDYSAAKELLDGFFKDDEYSNLSLMTYENYVNYYEKQGLYLDSAKFQLDYIEQKDGLANVREESKHYQMLQEALKNLPGFEDSRLNTIADSVATWKELSEAQTANDYDKIISTTRSLIKNGNESVTAYLYLSQALRSKGEHLEEAKVYFCYLSKDSSTLNQLENNYYSMFSNAYNMLYFNGQIDSDDIDSLEDDFDYKNYFN